MPKLHYPAVAVATLAALVSGFLYYLILGGQLAAAGSAAATSAGGPSTMLVELARCFVLTLVVAILGARTGTRGWRPSVALALILWVGFPLVLWVGAIVHESTPVALAAIHAGDWLVKLFVVSLVLGLWRGRRRATGR